MLKTKTITTPSCTLLVCELPEGAIPEDSFCDAIMYKLPDGYVETEYPIESDGSWIWQLLNRLPEVTEEQAAKVIPTMPIQKGKTKRYITAKEAMHSILESEGVYFNNPYGKEPDYGTDETETISDYLEAQEQVWDRNRTYIFKQLK